MKFKHDHLDDPIIAHVRQDQTVLYHNQTINEVLEQVRTQGLGEKIVYFYVVDANEKLIGVVPTRRLLTAAPHAIVSAIMLRGVIAIPCLATVMEACEWFIQYRFLAFPVIDAERRLMGVVDVSLFTNEIFQVTERHNYEDVFQLIGVQFASQQLASPLRAFAGRFPWLLCNIGGGLACAMIASRYEDFLNAVIVLALFIPVVLALSESVSMQSMTITLQRLHGTHFRFRELWRAVVGELLVAAMLGLSCGAVVGSVAWFWKGEPKVALAMLASITFSVISACLLGVALPSAVHALKVDPKIAAGPIVLAAADLATLLFYFNLSMTLLS